MSRLVLAALAGAVALASPALAAGPDRRPVAEARPTSPRDLQIAIRRSIAAGDYDEARRLASSGTPDDAHRRTRVRFVEGLVLEAQGRHGEAAAIYRGILVDEPDLVGVRVQLSRALFADGDDDAARYQLDTLVASGIDRRLGGELGNLVDRIDQRRPLRGRLFLSALPSSNLNSGTDATTVELGGVPLRIDDVSRRKSGVGVLLGAEASYRHDLGGDASILIGGSAVDRFYPSIDRHYLSLGGSVGVASRLGDTKFVASLIGGRDVAGVDLGDWRRSYDYLGVSLEGTRALSADTRLTAGTTIRRQWFQSLEDRDGWAVDGTVYLDKFLAPTRYLRAIAGAAAERTATDRLDFDEGTIGAGAFSELPAGFSLYGEGTASFRGYHGDFPGLDEPRSDTRLRARVTATKRDLSIWGVAPQLTYSFVRNLSNSVFDDTTRHEVELRLTSEF